MVLAYLLLLTSVTFALYGYDKAQAVRYGGRVPETVLLALGFLGGTVGAIMAMQVFRHKRKKGSYLVKFWGLVLLQLGLLIYYPDRIFGFIKGVMHIFF